MQELRWHQLYSSCRCNLLEDHLEGAVVEGVPAHNPHDLFLYHDLVRSPGEGCAKGLDTRQDPEGLCWRDSQRAIWTYGRSMEREKRAETLIDIFSPIQGETCTSHQKCDHSLKKVAGQEEEKQFNLWQVEGMWETFTNENATAHHEQTLDFQKT